MAGGHEDDAARARYRLRFGLQEVALPNGSSILGRDRACFVTLEDDLASREHAHIEVKGDVVTVHDLDSRNGVYVNGQRLLAARILVAGDRVRIGTHEMLLVDGARTTGQRRRRETTGKRVACPRCETTFAEEGGACPGCGTSVDGGGP